MDLPIPEEPAPDTPSAEPPTPAAKPHPKARSRTTVTRLTAQITAQADELSELRDELRQLKAERSPVQPRPTEPAKPPKWAPQGDGSNVGMNFSGPPSETATSGGVSWLRKDADGLDIIPGMPSGMRYHSDGTPFSPARPEPPRPIGPPRDAKHDAEVKLIDRIIAANTE